VRDKNRTWVGAIRRVEALHHVARLLEISRIVGALRRVVARDLGDVRNRRRAAGGAEAALPRDQPYMLLMATKVISRRPLLQAPDARRGKRRVSENIF
jgi:hypothetical protein